MRPRKLFDITWPDLALGLASCLWPFVTQSDTHSFPDNTTTCLSVRSAFDLLLRALKLPPGSEILMTAITIPDMLDVVHEHGLVPVPIDMEIANLQPCYAQLEARITSRTRLILVAPLFGTQIDLRPICETARRYGLLVIEDGAQSFCGPRYLGQSEADVNLMSFGPIKTATALAGALVHVRDQALHTKMRRIQEGDPRQSQTAYTLRLLKFALLKLLTTRPLFDLFLWLNQVRGRDPDQAIQPLTRNFARDDVLVRIRQRPSYPLIAMIARRWANYAPSRIDRRARLGNQLATGIAPKIQVVGIESNHQTYWVFPVLTESGEQLVQHLRRAGFDATQCHNLCLVSPDSKATPQMERLLREIVFLPIYPELSEREVQAMILAVPNGTASSLKWQKRNVNQAAKNAG